MMNILLFLIIYGTPVVAIIFFISCVALLKKIKKGDADTANLTGWCALMFAFLVSAVVYPPFM